ncbi:MAG: CDF family Co(II)/Ni(II) efflux transporter DmeF [Alphaproteobacteria bacterium]|nr:CDF family Co(II)/Ni(II) efflux transporter DmeF [Alphaproteobacteria bacterium]
MRTHTHKQCGHLHTFGLDQKQEGERRTFLVFAITIIMMVIEIAAGMHFGSIALLADGLHMGSHATALGINTLAYIYARRYAHDPRFTFGTGKINALGGYTGAVLLGFFAVTMAWEGGKRLLYPQPIAFDWALAVAVIGLAVNAASVLILDVNHGHGHDHGHGHSHDEGHGHAHDHAHSEDDLNLRSAYLHVLADALTSVTAIIALLAGKYLGAVWMDPAMGFVGAVLILRWSWSLLQQTGLRLLDYQAPSAVYDAVHRAIEADEGTEIFDLHVWLIAPGTYAAIIGIITHDPKEPDYYKTLLPDELGIRHLTVEVHPCSDEKCPVVPV